jgi:hypothetical protein
MRSDESAVVTGAIMVIVVAPIVRTGVAFRRDFVYILT